MIEKIKRQSIGKILIMIWNLFRVLYIQISHFGHVKISFLQNINPSTEIAVGKGILKLDHSIFTRRHVSLRVEEGILEIGTCFFNQGCSVIARKKIIIGDDCLFGPNVVIVDHDHDYHCLDVQRGAEYICKEVIIGNNVVVGANTVILKGTHIGDNCMIGAGCVVSGNIEPETLYYEHREPVSKPIRFKEANDC